MPERVTDILALLMSALAVGYCVFEIERRRQKMRDVWNVLHRDDALLTEMLEQMVARGELQPYTGATLA